MTTTVTYQCGCTAQKIVKGVREARQYQNWLGSKDCPDCEMTEEDIKAIEAALAEPDIPMTLEGLKALLQIA